MKKNPLYCCFIFFFVHLISCSGGGDNGGGEPTEKIKIGYLPIAECLPLYVAKEKGFFEKHGLEVELISASSGPVIFKELDAGTIDIGFSNVVSLIKQNNSGKDYVSLFGGSYETANNVNHGMFILKGFDMANLRQAKFGVNARNNIEELMLLNYLKSKGIMPDENVSTNISEHTFPQMLPDMRDKLIDISCVVEPFITIAKNDTATYSYIGNHYATDSTAKILVATYVTKSAFAKDKESVAANFIAAMEDATNEINNASNNLRDIILKYSKIDQKLLAKISLPLFQNKIEPADLDHIMSLMYDSVLNRNKTFIPHPEKKMDASAMIYNKIK